MYLTHPFLPQRIVLLESLEHFQLCTTALDKVLINNTRTSLLPHLAQIKTR